MKSSEQRKMEKKYNSHISMAIDYRKRFSNTGENFYKEAADRHFKIANTYKDMVERLKSKQS